MSLSTQPANPTTSRHMTTADEGAAARPQNASSATLVMQSAPAVSPASEATGLASPRYARDLANLAKLIAAPSLDHTAIAGAANRLIADHAIVEGARDIIRLHAALLPVATQGIAATGEVAGCAVDGIIEGTYDPMRYHARLAPLAPRVHSGELTVDDARRKAARPFLGKLGSFFSRGADLEIEVASMKEQRGVVLRAEAGAVAFTTQETLAPDYYDLSKRSWQDLATSVVVDGKGGVAVDPFDPTGSYATLLRGLSYLGDVARYAASRS